MAIQVRGLIKMQLNPGQTCFAAVKSNRIEVGRIRTQGYVSEETVWAGNAVECDKILS